MTTLKQATIAELVELYDLLNDVTTTVDDWMQTYNNEKILRKVLIAEIQGGDKKRNNYDLLYWNAKKITTAQLVELDNWLNGVSYTVDQLMVDFDSEDELRQALIEDIQDAAKN